MQQTKHSATRSRAGKGVVQPPTSPQADTRPSPLETVTVDMTRETRTALHHLAGRKQITPRRLLRALVEDAVAQESR